MRFKKEKREPEILFEGYFTPNDFVVSISPSNRAIDPKVEEQLDAIWQQKEQEAKEKKLHFYNGVSYRLNSFSQEGNKIHLDFGEIFFKVRFGLPQIPEYFDLPEEYYRKGCFTGATVRTSDDKYLMVELSGKSMNQNKIDMIGGMVETDIPLKTGQDIWAQFYDELEEEALVIPADVASCILRAVYLTTNTNVGFYFQCDLAISSQEVVRNFESKSKHVDIQGLKLYSYDSYREMLGKHNKNKEFLLNFISKKK